MGNEGPVFAGGFLVGAMIMLACAFLLIIPAAHDDQFNKDCVRMAHGTVDKSAHGICVKNGKILFHK